MAGVDSNHLHYEARIPRWWDSHGVFSADFQKLVITMDAPARTVSACSAAIATFHPPLGDIQGRPQTGYSPPIIFQSILLIL